MRAIVVDDSRAMRRLLKMVLREVGVEVVAEAANGKEGLDAVLDLGHELPDLMLLDWNMPLMDGFELLQIMRRSPQFAPMRIMMVTTENEAPQILRALDAGADEYLIKPFTRAALKAKLELLGQAE